MKRFWAALMLSVPLTAWSGTWTLNNDNFLVTYAESTADALAVNLCMGAMAFMSRSEPGRNGKKAEIDILIRIDSLITRPYHVVVEIRDDVAMTAVPLSEDLVKELVQGKTLRVKWADHVYSHFDLQGFAQEALKVNCDSEFFSKDHPQGDSDYFL